MSLPPSRSAVPTPPPFASPLRVLHISGRSDHGGGPEHIRQVIAAGLSGIEHHVACPDSGIYWSRYQELIDLSNLCTIPHRRLSLPALHRLLGFVRRHEIQVLHSHGTAAGIYSRVLGTMLGLPVVHSFHGVPVTRSLKHGIYTFAERLLSHATTCGVAVSAGEADLVHVRWRHYRGRLAVVPNGIDITAEPPPWIHWNASDCLRIVSFTRRNTQKNPELLIEVARCLHLLGASFRIDAYGEGMDHPALSALAARRGVADRMHFHPPTDSPRDALAGAHVYLSTSRWEGMPLAVLEAWRAGLVVVASDVVGNRDLVEDGRTGFLFKAGDGRAAAHLLRGLGDDLPTIERLRKRAARRALIGHCHSLMAMRLQWLYWNLAERTQMNQAFDAESWPKEAENDDDSSVRMQHGIPQMVAGSHL